MIELTEKEAKRIRFELLDAASQLKFYAIGRGCSWKYVEYRAKECLKWYKKLNKKIKAYETNSSK